MEAVFKALADPHRRHLLDRLREPDGQTLNELQAEPSMTRLGVMKHLRVLAEAGLDTSRKVGREKFRFLNPLPLRGVYDR
jgi:DNA-binding transcriptional ArsR family regulator